MNLLATYAVIFSAFKEQRCTPRNTLTLECVIGRLTSFQISNFDNYTPATIESTFKSQLVLSKRKGKYVKSDSDSYDDEIDELEVLIAK